MSGRVSGAPSGSAAGRRGRPRSLALDSAEPGILVRWVSREPVGIGQTASGRVSTCGAGLCIRPTALLACSLAWASPNARRPAARSGGRVRDASRDRRLSASASASVRKHARRRWDPAGLSAITHASRTARPPRPAADDGRRAGLPRSRPESVVRRAHHALSVVEGRRAGRPHRADAAPRDGRPREMPARASAGAHDDRWPVAARGGTWRDPPGLDDLAVGRPMRRRSWPGSSAPGSGSADLTVALRADPVRARLSSSRPMLPGAAAAGRGRGR